MARAQRNTSPRSFVPPLRIVAASTGPRPGMTSGFNGDARPRTTTLRTSPSQGRSWREKDPDRRLPLFLRMSNAMPVSTAHFPLPATSGKLYTTFPEQKAPLVFLSLGVLRHNDCPRPTIIPGSQSAHGRGELDEIHRSHTGSKTSRSPKRIRRSNEVKKRTIDYMRGREGWPSVLRFAFLVSHPFDPPMLQPPSPCAPCERPANTPQRPRPCKP